MHSFLLILLATAAVAQKFSVPTPPKGTQVDSPPQLGIGTWHLTDAPATEAIANAITIGYRHIDAARAYGNQKEIGAGIKDGLKRSGIERRDLWITSKLWNNNHGDPERGLNETLQQLGLDYLDLYLMHWPMGNSTGKDSFDYLTTWKAMEKLVARGTTRYIGVSNFSPAQLDALIKEATIKPKAHQFEAHPYLQQQAFIEANFAKGIETVIAYAPLGNTNPVYSSGGWGTMGFTHAPLLTHPVIAGIAKERACTPAQVVLAWNMKRGLVVIPKAERLEHQRENLDTPAKCRLEDVDVQKIAGEIKERVRLNALPCRGLGYTCFEGLTEGAPFCGRCA